MRETFVSEVTFLSDYTCTVRFEDDGFVRENPFRKGDKLRGSGWPFGPVHGSAISVKKVGDSCDITYISDTGAKTYLGIPKGILVFGNTVLVEEGQIVGAEQ
jgi:hypothetical protein